MDTDYDAIILGAGAAGLAAGLYTTRAMMKTLLIEQLGPGGQLLITDEIDNYPGFPEGVKGQELAMMMEQQTTRFGADIEYTEVQGLDDVDKPVKTVHTDDRDYTAKSLIIATGGSHNKLGVAGRTRMPDGAYPTAPFATAISSVGRMWWSWAGATPPWTKGTT